MSNELIRKTDVLDLLNDFYSDFEEYSHLFDDIVFMNPVNAVELPCKIGDRAWGIRNWRGHRRIKEGKISEVFFHDNMELIIVVSGVCRGLIGKHVFLTRAEAEAALRKMKGEAE